MNNIVEKKNTHARVNDQLFIDVRWARIFNDDKSAKKAQFSGDLYTNDGTKICTINRLCVLNTTDKVTGKKTIYIGSMSERLPKGDTIYALTWFPDAKKGLPSDVKARENFATECVNAIAAFHQKEQVKLEQMKRNRHEDHPDLKPLAAIGKKL
jgi:hypothetical protein